ncbi:hypothetical protein [Klebsiella pneumoniae]|uniref:hypothetical protein n=7 Tax=Klebsiella/Raoultella group TaxID=2890311 RepID=UPI000FDBB32C|nr:hypothetical protein [Klebsiella pneumoniae]RVS47390.1 hypothetical protein EOL09_11120 [Klebsiella pneumoniae]
MRVEDNKAPELLKCAISSMAQICVKKHHNVAFYKPILTKMSIWSKKGCIISLAEYSALPRTRGGAANPAPATNITNTLKGVFLFLPPAKPLPKTGTAIAAPISCLPLR